jgi:hypothetical protein
MEKKNSSQPTTSNTHFSISSRAQFLVTHRRQRLQGFSPQLDEFYFTTVEKKILENYRCIVPNSMND